MKTIRKIIILFILFLFTCTENPFFGDNRNTSDNLTVKGNVSLEGQTDHSGVYVWLKDIDVITQTNNDGNFKLQLPSPQTLPGGAGAWNGNFTIYFYMSNYSIDSISILIKDGKSLSNRNDIGDNGKLKHNIILRELSYISGSVDTVWIDPFTDVEIGVSMRVTPPIDGNRIITYLDTADTIIAFFLCPMEEPLTNAKQFFIPPGSSVEGQVQRILYGSHTITVNLEPGEYKVVPYYHVKHKGLPKAIFTKIGYIPTDRPNSFNLDFLKVPIRVEGQTLIVRHSSSKK